MARPSTAPRRYAEAAFELAERDGSIDAWGEDLATVASLIGDERVIRVVDDPSRPYAERQATIDKLLGTRVRPPVKNLVRLLSERRRLDLVTQISAEYRRLLNRHNGIVTAIVTSATPLTTDETAALEQRLRAMTGATVELEMRIDESLIGGLTVRVGDRLLDASVRGRLERLREQLIAGNRLHTADAR
ncbi:MAG TPA: F0F1 ATP synthase subunit delta [Candidatus Limnocylindrales bacterium]|nr:F0F1 ATP synthase subunit delta [Candidatus Limnocylindrales bacterium]